MKWADFCISRVKHSSTPAHIDSVLAIEDLGEKFGEVRVLTRHEVIKGIRKGQTFITMTLGKNGWDKGQLVKIISVNGTEYIKTLPDKMEKDNLGILPELQ